MQVMAETLGKVRGCSVLDQTHRPSLRTAEPSHAVPSVLQPEPRTNLDTLVPQVDGGVEHGGLDHFLENQC